MQSPAPMPPPQNCAHCKWFEGQRDGSYIHCMRHVREGQSTRPTVVLPTGCSHFLREPGADDE